MKRRIAALLLALLMTASAASMIACEKEGEGTETKVTETKAPEKTAAPETTGTTEAKGGCGSAIGFAIVPVALTAGAICMIKRKKKDD